MSKFTFKQFLEDLELEIDDTDNMGTEDGKLLKKLKPQGKGQKTNQGIKSDRSEIADATKATKKAHAAGM